MLDCKIIYKSILFDPLIHVKTLTVKGPSDVYEGRVRVRKSGVYRSELSSQEHAYSSLLNF